MGYVVLIWSKYSDIRTRQIGVGKESAPVLGAATRCVRALAAASEWEARVLLHKETLRDISYLRKSQKQPQNSLCSQHPTDMDLFRAWIQVW